MRTEPCGNCSGEITLPPTFSTIRVPLTDDDGFPILDDKSTVMLTTLRLANHAIPESMMTRSVFDPTGLAPALCEHGLKEHPLGFPLKYGGRSWIRAKYLDVHFDCPIERGQEAPDDLATPANAA